MRPLPRSGARDYTDSGKLRDKVALVTGGDSGIGRAVALLFAKEGADIAVIYLNEHRDARETKRLAEAEGRKCLLLAGDVGREKFCKDAVRRTSRELGRINILVGKVEGISGIQIGAGATAFTRISLVREGLAQGASEGDDRAFGRRIIQQVGTALVRGH
jgi:NAD(P)-dependent dehydrogenase (short-subunit alcohol dehydrogenase family)